ncbi:MAG: hypothetical protein RL021_887 [Bacteroidota bacterium]|jgi:hypothetical protein
MSAVKRFLAASVMVSVIGTFSCKKQEDYSPDCSGAPKTFSADAKPALQSNCVSCHSQYANYNTVKNEAASIRSAIANGSMPKGKKMSDSDKNKVMCWIDSGAPNN